MEIDLVYPGMEMADQLPRGTNLRDHDLEKKVIEDETVSHKDIQNYARFVVDTLKNWDKTDPEQERIFIVDALSDDRILGQFTDKIYDQTLPDEERLDEFEAKSAIARIRKALVDELKGKIDEEIYLVVKDFKNTDRDKAKGGQAGFVRRSIVGEITPIASGRDNAVFKDQEAKIRQEVFEEAYQVFRQLPAHPYIRKIKEYDSKTNRFILEKRDFVPIDKFLEREKLNKDDFTTALQAVIDCLSALEFLSINGLVWQDMHPYNVGVENKEEKWNGLLFDPEGLAKKGKKFSYRIGDIGRNQKGATFLDTGQADPECFSPKETVHQLAESVVLIRRALISYYEKNNKPMEARMVSLSNQMSDLAYDMQKRGKMRLGLAKSLERLIEIKQKFEQYSL